MELWKNLCISVAQQLGNHLKELSGEG